MHSLCRIDVDVNIKVYGDDSAIFKIFFLRVETV